MFQLPVRFLQNTILGLLIWPDIIEGGGLFFIKRINLLLCEINAYLPNTSMTASDFPIVFLETHLYSSKSSAWSDVMRRMLTYLYGFRLISSTSYFWLGTSMPTKINFIKLVISWRRNAMEKIFKLLLNLKTFENFTFLCLPRFRLQYVMGFGEASIRHRSVMP